MQLVAFSPGTVTLTLRPEETPAFDLSATAGPAITLSTENRQLVLEVASPGPAATVAVGSTSTLPAGSSATVTNSGSALAAVLNFGIPRGEQGLPGNTGATGATGATGPAGTAATITVGSTSTLTPGSPATVTNSGTSSAAVFDFGIPSGTTIQTQAQVRNETGSTLVKGTVVYITGAAGNKCLVTKAQANSEPTSAQTFGIVIADILHNQNGYVCTAGLLENLDTLAFAAGTQLYLSPTTAGGWTSTKPSAPNHLVYLGIVERSHQNQGTLQVRIGNGFELEELHNVSITSPATGDLLVRSGSLWVNSSIATLGLATQSWVTAQGYLTASSLTGYATQSWVSAQGYLTSSSLTGYATQAWVDAHGYLQAGALTGYALQSWVTSQGYITSSALSGYLLASTAAATYQPIGSYLTDAPSDGTPYVRLNGAWEQLIIT